MENELEPIFIDDPERSRYRAEIDGRTVGYSEYRTEPGRVIFTHTVVRPEYEGRGIGSRLAEFAVNDARASGRRITPVCPFVRAYLRRHAEYHPIVDFPPNTEDEDSESDSN